MTTEPKIAPRFVDGEPVCSGEECPRFYWSNVDDQCMSVFCGRGDDLLRFCQSQPEKVPCIPMLRCQRDELREERDAARRELCEEKEWTETRLGSRPCDTMYIKHTIEEYAVSRGWSYLYTK